MNHLLTNPRPADIARAARLITAAETECEHVFAPAYRCDVLIENTDWPRDYIAKVVEVMTPPPPPNAINVKQRLLCQKNGMIVVETTGEGFVHTTGARDLRFRMEYRTTSTEMPWAALSGEYDDEVAARKALMMSNRHINYRLVALNDIGWVALPKRWKGYCE